MAISSKHLWEQVLNRLKEQLSRPTFETWMQNATVENLTTDSLTITVPNAFVMNHLQKHYVNIISDLVAEINGNPLEIV